MLGGMSIDVTLSLAKAYTYNLKQSTEGAAVGEQEVDASEGVTAHLKF